MQSPSPSSSWCLHVAQHVLMLAFFRCSLFFPPRHRPSGLFSLIGRIHARAYAPFFALFLHSAPFLPRTRRPISLISRESWKNQVWVLLRPAGGLSTIIRRFWSLVLARSARFPSVPPALVAIPVHTRGTLAARSGPLSRTSSFQPLSCLQTNICPFFHSASALSQPRQPLLHIMYFGWRYVPRLHATGLINFGLQSRMISTLAG